MKSDQQDKPALGLFLGILVWYAIAFYVFGVAKLLPEHFQNPFVTGALVITIVYWTGFLFVSYWRWFRSWARSWKACEHGVRGGSPRPFPELQAGVGGSPPAVPRVTGWRRGDRADLAGALGKATERLPRGSLYLAA
jgi:hypothetical protein